MSPLTRAGLLVGLGFGALGETLLFGTLLGWHHVVCPDETCRALSPEQVAGMSSSDGVLMLAACGLVFLGILSLFEAARRPGSVWSYKTLVGGILSGAGVYGVGEGVFAHWLLRVHHLVSGPMPWIGDGLYLFFACGALLAGVGMVQAGRRDRERSFSIPEIKSRWYLG